MSSGLFSCVPAARFALPYTILGSPDPLTLFLDPGKCAHFRSTPEADISLHHNPCRVGPFADMALKAAGARGSALAGLISPLTGLNRVFNLSLDDIQVKRSKCLHRPVVDGRLRQLGDALLYVYEATQSHLPLVVLGQLRASAVSWHSVIRAQVSSPCNLGRALGIPKE
jgi:hypothetical protein